METRRKSLFNSEIIFLLQIFLILSSNVLCTDDCNDKNYDHLTVVTNDNQCIQTDDSQLESTSNYDPVLSVTPSEIINLNELKSDSKSLNYLSMPSLEAKTEKNENEIQPDENNEKIVDKEFIKKNINFNTIKESFPVDENISVNLSTTEIPESELDYHIGNEIITSTDTIETKNDDEIIIKNQEDYTKLINPINLSNENEFENKDDNLKASKLISNMELDDSLEVNSEQIQSSALLYEATTVFNAKLYNNSSPNDKQLSDFEKYKNSSFNFGDLYEMCNGSSDCDLNTLPIRPSAQTQREKLRDTSSSIPEVSIQFADVPLGNEFQVDQLHLSEGTFLFDYLGDFLSWLQPNNFPVELMRDAIRNQISIYELLTQSLKLEAGFIAVLVAGILLALAAPIVVLSHTCYRLRKRKGDENFEETWSGNCRRRSLVFILQILIILLLVGIVAIVVTNQQVGDGVLQTNHALQTILSDLDTFLGNSHLQLHFAVSKHLEQVVQAVDADLNNVEVLLGQPIQVELSRETGVDVALDSLRNIAQDATKVSELVELVQLAAGLVGEGIILTRDKLSDLRLQVDSFRRQCATRDRSLCDTINVIGLDITTRVDIIRQDDKLKRIRQIGGPDLRSAVEAARILYRDIPRQVESDTKMERQDVRRQLNQKQIRIDENVRTLDTFFRNLRGKVIKSQNSVDDISSEIPELEFWRWISGLGAVGLILLVWVLLQSGISCGCCGSGKAAAPTLLICVLMICLVSTVLWLVSLVLLIVGGHGQVFICRPLYEEPEFPALSQLLDRPGLFQNPHNFLSTLTYGNDTMDVPLNKVLRDCEANRAIYPTFQLSGIFSVDKMAESRQWDSLQENIDKMNVKLDHINLLSPNLYQQLDDLQQGLSVNLTAHRVQLSEPLMGKDLNAFAAQLDSVGNQLSDLATASRIETLATRTRRLIATHIDPLKEKKENLVYQLTALEVQLGPLHRQVEQSISHLKTIQFFINSQGNTIASKKSSEYRRRLISYLDQYRIHLTDKMNNDIAKCQPLWKLFHATRLMLCKNIMDPLNGFWFSIVWCLLLLLFATPICLKLVDYYRQKSHSCSSHLSGSPSENLMSNEQGKDWSSPNESGDNGGGGGW